MATVMVPEYGSVQIPGWVADLNSFRTWVHSGVLPEKLKVHFIRGEVWVDLHMEELFSHNRVKTAVYVTLAGIVDRDESGLLLVDGMLFTNDAAELGAEPDGMFVSFESFRTNRVRTRAGKTTGAVATELVGSPDVVIEVVSRGSVDKDTEKLMAQYHDAGVTEYWLLDARKADIRFDIFRHEPTEFVAAESDGGWVRSDVFGRSFRLIRTLVRPEFPNYKLEAR
ncbi:MAG: Uma2 family endonuclease [Fimbriiglobus sp.]